MNLKEQNYICSVAELQSITAAANRLHISQSALTQAVQNVERGLGVRLFDRLGKRMALTPAGRLYVEKAQKMLTLKLEFEEELKDMSQNYDQQIRVGVQDLYSDRILPQMIREFRDYCPKVRLRPLERRVAVLEKKLRDNELDLAFVNLFADPTHQFDQVPLVTEHTMLAVSGSDPRLKTARTWACPDSPYPYIDVKAFEDGCFIMTPSLYRSGYDAEYIFRQLNIQPQRTQQFQRVATILRMTALGEGVCLTLPRYVRLFGLERELELFEVEAARKETTFGALCLRGKELPPYATRLINIAREQYEKI